VRVGGTERGGGGGARRDAVAAGGEGRLRRQGTLGRHRGGAPARDRAVRRDHAQGFSLDGERPGNALDRDPAYARAGQLRAAASAARPIVFEPVRYRETRSVGMLVLDDAGAAAGDLARDLHERLRRLGVYEPETRRWLAHVTVVRFRRAPRLAPPPPALGPFSPSDAALYHSVLRRGGAQYEALESVRLGGG